MFAAKYHKSDDGLSSTKEHMFIYASDMCNYVKA